MEKAKRVRRLLSLVFMMLLSLSVSAQTTSKKQVTLDMQNVTVKEFFAEVKKQTGLNFIYDADEAAKWPKISIKVQKRPVEEAIDQMATSIGCKYNIKDNIVTVTK